MKNYLIKLLLPSAIEMIINALVNLSRKSNNTIDDMIVGAFIAHKDDIINDIKANN